MVVDFHTHILPKLDDGSRSLEESLKMLRLEAEQGIHHIIATPHFYPQHDTPTHFLESRKSAEMRLREAIANFEGMPKLSVGAEVHYFSGISESDILYELTIDSKKSILIELPQAPWTERIFRDLEGIWEKHGITPIVAHVDRYLSPFKTHGIPERLMELPVKVQANASFFINRRTRKMALRLLREDKIHLLGSDCHNMTSRIPNLKSALEIIENKLGREALEKINTHESEILKYTTV